jgi:hypothetical protein
MDKNEWNEEQLRQLDQARFDERKERARRTKVHGIIPFQFFSAVSTECRELFIDGHFYGCVSLVQALADGISQFLRGIHSVGAKNDPRKRVERLRDAGAITSGSCNAFLQIWGNDRNTFHHLNPDIPTDVAVLEERAEECVNCLYTIESELFAFDISNGALVPKNRAYWSEIDPEHLQVFLRLGGH